MVAGTGPAVRRRQLITELKRLREATGLTQEEVAGQLDWHPTKIMRIETGAPPRTPTTCGSCWACTAFPTPEVLSGLLKLAKDARQRGWWYSYKDVLLSRFELFLGLESEADTIRDFELTMIPGLLQTDDYARELIRGLMAYDAAEIERRIELRMARHPAAVPDGVRERGTDRALGRVDVRTSIDEDRRDVPIVAAGGPMKGGLLPGLADVGVGAGFDK